ncbi:hypothetical protein H0H87_006082 [Tephrocybe sp. NHM501043]|nr:hypothetical protein H0H87_006082 [Tephrocybe sp. NHM501043]
MLPRTLSQALKFANYRARRWIITKSYVEGPLDPPLETRTLGDYYTSVILRAFPSRPALICRGERPNAHHGPRSRNMDVTTHLAWDFAELDRHINALAQGLLRMGVRTGDRVGALKLVGVKHLFIVPRIRSSAYFEMLTEALPNLRHSKPGDIQCEELPELRNLVVVDNAGEYGNDMTKLDVKGAIDWREILIWREDAREKDMQRDISASLNKDDIINLQFTSGTTGAPKAVSLTHYNLLNDGISIGRCMRLTPNDIVSAWAHGASILYPSEIFDPEAIVDAIASERCTTLHGVPTHFQGVLSELEKRQAAKREVDTSSLRTGVAAGSPIPIEMMKQLITRLNLVDLTNAYGMTDDIIKRVETVGKVHPHVKAKIVDAEGNIVPIGKTGELCVAGYLLQKGYWDDEQHTLSVTKTDSDGTVWMHTGDEGILDEDGYLRIVGRRKDIIIRGGENLFPVQIENALMAQQGIEEAAVVSVPDETYGEVVGAWIVRRQGTSTSRESIRAVVAKSMNPQNAPTWMWFLGEDGAQDELPKTASGKVMKHVLREWSKDLAKKEVGRVLKS